MSNASSSTLSQPARQRFLDLRKALLHLHRVLMEAERAAYEQVHGRVSGGALLQLVIHHEQFDWLHPISRLIVQMDEMLDAEEPISSEDMQALFTDTRSLLTPSETGNAFERKYDEALQRDPTAVMAHGAVSQLLTATD